MHKGLLSILAISATLGLGNAASAHDDSHGGHGHGPAAFDAGEPGEGAKIARRVDVVAREGQDRMSFEPASIQVVKGENIEFVVHNEGQLEHEFVLGSAIENASHAAMMEAMPDMKHEDANAVWVAPGKSARLVWTFSKQGEFEFACLIPGHYDAGMKGNAVVN